MIESQIQYIALEEERKKAEYMQDKVKKMCDKCDKECNKNVIQQRKCFFNNH
ncbi:MAG: hypothetical protein MJZ34_13640 [Paludibacteraceae bacterium]|nr:hypothetical protein [Paludibacteraceae bacterium]